MSVALHVGCVNAVVIQQKNSVTHPLNLPNIVADRAGSVTTLVSGKTSHGKQILRISAALPSTLTTAAEAESGRISRARVRQKRGSDKAHCRWGFLQNYGLMYIPASVSAA